MRMLRSLMDDNYIFSNENIGFCNEKIFNEKNYNLFKGLIRLLYRFYVSTKCLSFSIFKIPKRSIVGLAGSENNYVTLKNLQNEIDLTIFSFLKKFPDSKQVPIFYAYIISVLFFPLTILYYVLGGHYVRKSFVYSLNEYYLIVGLRLFYWGLFKIIRPKYIIIVNDHILYYRAAIKVANFLKIKTVYIQHASVTDKFPPLIMDYAFLDGEDSKNKYMTAGKSETNIILSGSSKYDILYNIKRVIHEIQVVGIATNEFDDFSLVQPIIIELKKDFKIILRPHPNDKRYYEWQRLAIENRVIFSPSKKECTLDFLNLVDCIVSYNSNIHLESLISGRPAFSIQLSHKIFDYYGFVEKGLVIHYNNVKDLKIELTNYSESKKNELCKYYYALYDTEKAGKSSEYISEKLKQMID